MPEPKDLRRNKPQRGQPAVDLPGRAVDPATVPEPSDVLVGKAQEGAITTPIAEVVVDPEVRERAKALRQFIDELISAIPEEAFRNAKEACDVRTRLIERRLRSSRVTAVHYNEVIRVALAEHELNYNDYEMSRIIATVPATEYPQALQAKYHAVRQEIMNPIDDGLRQKTSGLDDLFPDPALHRADLYQVSYEYVLARRRLDKSRDHGRDSLTGMINDRSFLAQMFEVQLKLLALLEEHCAMAVVRMDLDGFKGVNDIFGHDEGDRILREFSAALSRQFRRSSDIMTITADRHSSSVEGRPGGDEFLLIVNDIDTRQTDDFDESDYAHFPEDLLTSEGIGSRWLFNVAVRIMRAARSVTKPDGTPLTVSIGYARVHKQEAARMLYGSGDGYPMLNFEDYNRRADEAAERSKTWGDGVAQEWGPNRPRVPMTEARVRRKIEKSFRRDHPRLPINDEVSAMLDNQARLLAQQYQELEKAASEKS